MQVGELHALCPDTQLSISSALLPSQADCRSWLHIPTHPHPQQNLDWMHNRRGGHTLQEGGRHPCKGRGKGGTRLGAAPCTMSLALSSSRSGRSLATTTPSSWSSSPVGVMQKLSRHTRVHTWVRGGAVGLGKGWGPACGRVGGGEAEGAHAHPCCSNTHSHRAVGTPPSSWRPAPPPSLFAHLWRVVGVAQLGGHVELEARRPLRDAVAQLDAQHARLRGRGKRLKEGVCDEHRGGAGPP